SPYASGLCNWVCPLAAHKPLFRPFCSMSVDCRKHRHELTRHGRHRIVPGRWLEVGPPGCKRNAAGARAWKKSMKIRVVSQFEIILLRQRRTATPAQIASTTPNGQAPWRKPYIEATPQAPANARTYQGLLSSSA